MTKKLGYKGKKLLRRPMVHEVAGQFKKNLPPRLAEPKRIMRTQRRLFPHYELSQAAITEFIQAVGEALEKPAPLRCEGSAV